MVLKWRQREHAWWSLADVNKVDMWQVHTKYDYYIQPSYQLITSTEWSPRLPSTLGSG